VLHLPPNFDKIKTLPLALSKIQLASMYVLLANRTCLISDGNVVDLSEIGERCGTPESNHLISEKDTFT